MKHLIISLIIAAICIGLSLAVTQAIFNSDLPDWMKFWLLMG